MTAQLSPAPVFRSWDNLGFPLVGGKLFTYAAGTTTPQATYVDSTQTTPNTNPVILNFRGEAFVWLNPLQSYKFVLQDAFGNLIWTEDNIQGAIGVGSNIVPSATNTFTLGTPTLTFANGYFGPNGAPVFDPVSGNIGYYARTAAEISVGVTPVNYSYPPYTFLRYGADPTDTLDSTIAINNCFAAAKKAGPSKVSVGIPGAIFKVCTGGLSAVPINYPADGVGCDWQGAQLDCRGMPTAAQQPGFYCAVPVATYSDSNSLPGLIQSHPMEGVTAIGPCTPANLASYAGTGFISFAQSTSFPCGVILRDGGSWNFYTHANYGNGAFFISFQNWAFDDVTYAGVPGKSNLYINMPVATTSGERNIFFNCRFGAAPAWNQANGNADTHFIGCSFDPIGTAGLGGVSGKDPAFTITNGAVFFSHWHLEGSGDGPSGGTGAQYYWFYMSGQNTTVGWDSLTIVVDGPKVNYPLFFCDSSVTNGALSIGDTFFVDSTAYVLPLVGGTGRVFQKGVLTVFGGGTAPQYVSSSLNLLSDPFFTNNSFARDGWTAGGTVAPTLVNTPLSPGATNVVKFTCATSNNNTLTLTRFCRPGQIATGQVYVETSAFSGSGATLNINLNYLDQNGDILRTNAWGFPGITTTIGSFAIFPAQQGGGDYICAPPGTVSVQLAINVAAGAVTGTPLAYIGSPTLNVQ